MTKPTIKLLLLLLLSSGMSYSQTLELGMPVEQEKRLLLPELITPGVTIEQTGMHNEVFVQQISAVPYRNQHIGERQYATLVQNGHYNALDLTQRGGGNQVLVQQVGDGNNFQGQIQRCNEKSRSAR